MLIDLGILSLPLLLTFGPFARYDKRIGRVLAASLTAGAAFIGWDIWATARGHWGFNPKYVSEILPFGLPIEELLLFFIIPYSALFLYENLLTYVPDRHFRFPRWLNGLLVGAFAGAAVAFRGQVYTRTAMIACGLFFAAAAFYGQRLLRSSLFWIYMGIAFIPFFAADFLLTSPPIIWYNPAAIWGVRVATIPLENFFYTFALLGFYTLIYRGVGRRPPVRG
jgi:lycopene cyclase domain-containing protein